MLPLAGATGRLVNAADRCRPAWLLPVLVAGLAGTATGPVRVVCLAGPKISSFFAVSEGAPDADPRCPASPLALRGAAEIAEPFRASARFAFLAFTETAAREGVIAEARCSPRPVAASSSPPGTEIPTLASAAEAKSWTTPGNVPAVASPAPQASPAATRAATRGRDSAGMKRLRERLRGDGDAMPVGERTTAAIRATISSSPASSSAVDSADAASSSLATPA